MRNCLKCKKRKCVCLQLGMVGKAFVCSDGLIRWITHFSEREYFSVLWREDLEDVWHSGGIIKFKDLDVTGSAYAPQTGEMYYVFGATGMKLARIV